MGGVGEREAVMGKLGTVCAVLRAALSLAAALCVVRSALSLAALVAPPAPDALFDWGGWTTRLLSSALAVVGMLRGQRLCARIGASGTPFRFEFVVDLRFIAGVMLAAGIVPSFAGGVAALAAGQAFAVALDSSLLFAGGILAAASKVFEYGCILQEQDDGLL